MDIDFWYQNLLGNLNMTTCETDFKATENLIIEAAKLFNSYIQSPDTQDTFVSYCKKHDVATATEKMFGFLSGTDETCDLGQTLYTGFVYGGYFEGWKDRVMGQDAYLFSLGNIGFTVQTACDTIINSLDDYTQTQTLLEPYATSAHTALSGYID